MTTLQIRVDNAKAKIAKLNDKMAKTAVRIEKKKAQLAKETDETEQRYLGWDIEELEATLRSTQKELNKATEKLAEYKEKATAEEKKLASIPVVEAVESFLKNWETSAIAYYTAQVEAYKEFVAKEDRTVKYLKRLELRDKAFNKAIQSYAAETNAVAKITADMAKEVVARRIDLYTRCTEAVGVVTNATNLTLGNNGSINGFVIGEEGKAEVETIVAGGYNIQCLHYRVLVKKI